MGRKANVLVEPTKRLLASVGGLDIYSDSVYVITGKMDESAPTGFQERGIAKAPFPGNKTITQCSWDKFIKVYDTGFFPRSMCYKGWDKDKIAQEVRKRCDNIKAPFEEASGMDLFQGNLDFWDTKTVACYDGRLFYTNDVNDLLDLYIAVQSKALTPKEEDGNPLYSNSLYCVEDKTTAVDVKKQRQIDKMNIIHDFMTMLQGSASEKQKLTDLLLYLDIIHTSELDPAMIQYIFTNWIEDKNTNIDFFKDAKKRFVDQDDKHVGPQIISFNRMIKEMINGGVIGIDSSGLVFGGETIGADTISAAAAIVEDKGLLQVKAQIVEAYSKMKAKQVQVDE